jgi:hypothetical protein
MAAIPKHKPKTWRENRGEEILKYRNEIAPEIVEKMLKEEEAKEIKEAERTDSWLRKKKKKTIYKTPQIGSDEHPFDFNTGTPLAPDGGPKGDHILKDGKWVPVLEAKHGKLIKGFPKLTKRGWK